MSTASQQLSAIETAMRIVQGGVKLPPSRSEQAKLLAAYLKDAADTLREKSDVR